MHMAWSVLMGSHIQTLPLIITINFIFSLPLDIIFPWSICLVSLLYTCYFIHVLFLQSSPYPFVFKSNSCCFDILTVLSLLIKTHLYFKCEPVGACYRDRVAIWNALHALSRIKSNDTFYRCLIADEDRPRWGWASEETYKHTHQHLTLHSWTATTSCEHFLQYHVRAHCTQRRCTEAQALSITI